MNFSNSSLKFLYPSHQVSHYVVRNDLIEAIHDHFMKRLDMTASAIAILHGMGGCGKSQVALEYCRLGQNEKWFSGIFWFDASSPTTIAQSFADTAHELSKPNFDIADAKGNLKFVLEAIETKKINCLLVFDNFDDPSSFDDKSIKEYFPRGGNASVLFTTRHIEVKDLGRSIDVTLMSDQEALDLLLRRSQVERSEANMQEGANIVKRLGYHALAIDQAGAYIRAGALDLRLFMTHYTERQKKVLSKIPELWDYQRKLKTDSEVMTKLSVFATWELSVELITGTPTAKKDKIYILTLAAFLDSKEVSDDLFACYGSKNIDWLVSCVTDGVWDKYEAQDILKELRKLSLLQNFHTGKNGTTFSLHPLIQDWAKLRVNSDARREFAKQAILLLSAFLENQDVDNVPLSTTQAILSHLEVVIQNEKECIVLGSDVEGVELQDAASNFAVFFSRIGRYKLAEQMALQAFRWRSKVLGSEHPSTLRSMSNLATVLGNYGKYDESEKLLQLTLQFREKFFGREHPNTLDTMKKLAAVLERQGKYDEASRLLQQTIQLQEKVLGKDHPDTLQSISSLASDLRREGKYDQAQQKYQETLQLQEKVLGKDHPDTLITMTGLGAVLQAQDKYDEAQQIIQKTLQIQEEVIGKDHPNTLISIGNLAVVLEKQGKHNEAMSMYRLVVHLQEKVLGRDHPITVTSMGNFAALLERHGMYDEAIPLFHEVIHLQEKRFGKDHPNTIVYVNYLKILLEDLELSEPSTCNSSTSGLEIQFEGLELSGASLQRSSTTRST